MKNRAASIIFTRQAMHMHGLKASMLEDLMAELPEGTKIEGFGEDVCRNVIQINVSHPNFKEVPVGHMLPEITAKFTIDSDGDEDCEIDLSNVLEDGYETQCDESTNWRVKIVEKTVIIYDECLEDTHKPYKDITTFTAPKDGTYIICSTPRMGKSWIEEYWKRASASQKKLGEQTLTLPDGFTIDPSKLPRGYHPVKYTGVDQPTMMNDSWWGDDDDFGIFDINKDTDTDTEKPDSKYCNHEWKKVMGITRYYIICKHCEVRNKEEEEKQWED